MKEKKKSQNWRIGLIHYLIAGLVVPFLVRFILPRIFDDILHIADPLGQIWSFLVNVLVFDILPIWIAVMLSSKYFQKKYIIDNKNRVINLSTAYFLGVNFLSFLLLIIFYPAFNASLVFALLGMTAGVYTLAGIVLVACIFYILTRQYIGSPRIRSISKSVS